VLDGQYGISGVCVSLPFAVGAKGISGELLPKLAPEEEAALLKSAEAIKPFFEGI
jgi:L-lactate dehydrogenase